MTKLSFKLYTGIIAVFLFTGFFNSAFSFDSTYAAKIQLSLNQLKATYQLPGISAAVIVPGQGTWTGSSGISDSNNVLNSDMVFGIGSITKNFTAAAILKLQEQGLLNVNDSLHKYLPHYDNIDSNITLKELLQHTSGIYNYTDNPQFSAQLNANLDSLWEAESMLHLVLTPYFAHGTSWHYSNTNFILLGLIIEKVTNSSYPDVLRTMFFTPQGYNDIVLLPFAPPAGYFVHNWVDLDGNGTLDDASFVPTTAVYSCAYSAGSLVTSPLTLAKWTQAIFGGSILTPASLQEMTNFRNVAFGQTNGYGFGTMRYVNVAGRTIWGHGGNIFGFASIMLYSPTDSIVAIAITNKDMLTTTFGIPFMNAVLTNRPVGIQPVSAETPKDFELKQNYPNPFNPETTISFKLPSAGFASLQIYDNTGRMVESLVNEKLSAGSYNVKWNGAKYSSGVYYYTLRSENFRQSKKMLLIK